MYSKSIYLYIFLFLYYSCTPKAKITERTGYLCESISNKGSNDDPLKVSLLIAFTIPFLFPFISLFMSSIHAVILTFSVKRFIRQWGAYTISDLIFCHFVYWLITQNRYIFCKLTLSRLCVITTDDQCSLNSFWKNTWFKN